MASKLTSRQQAFVDAFEGNATAAALAAGYSAKTAAAIGSENLKKPEIVTAIKDRENKAIRPLIADRKKRQQFWSDTMLDKDFEMKDRLRASELLGKSEGDFLDRVELSGKIDLAAAIEEGRKRAGSSS